MKDIRNTFNLSKDEINTLLDRFAGATGEKTVMDQDEFCQCLNLRPGTREAEMLFSLLHAAAVHAVTNDKVPTFATAAAADDSAVVSAECD